MSIKMVNVGIKKLLNEFTFLKLLVNASDLNAKQPDTLQLTIR